MSEKLASNIRPPQGDGTNNSNVVLFAATTSSQTSALPKNWKGKWVRVKPVGGDVTIMFGASGISVDNTLAGTAAGKTDPTLGYPVADGTYEDFEIPNTADYVAFQGSAACDLHLLLTNGDFQS